MKNFRKPVPAFKFQLMRKCMEIPVELYYPNSNYSKHYLSELRKEIEYVDKALK